MANQVGTKTQNVELRLVNETYFLKMLLNFSPMRNEMALSHTQYCLALLFPLVK